MSTPNRVQAGVPAGGQFTATQHAEADVTLDGERRCPGCGQPSEADGTCSYAEMDDMEGVDHASGRPVITTASGERLLDLSDNGGYAPFRARLVMRGDRYGRDGVLTHDGDEPMIEFYDARYQHAPDYGQFVSRYNFSGYQGGCRDGWENSGLDLQGGVASWTLTAEAKVAAGHWADSEVARRAEHAP